MAVIIEVLNKQHKVTERHKFSQHRVALGRAYDNDVILYMKGSPSAPQCGFSQRASQALMACGQRFAYVDILTNPEIRSELPKFANWPTFPQLWVAGELIGGSDIILDMFQKGELQPLIQENSPAQA